jgi:prepilin-type N-terminal cleavage/methylation domain-containing protein
LNQKGYSITELMVVAGIIGVLSLLVPVSLSYVRAATTLEGARELQYALTRAKQLAVTTRQSICVQASGGGYQFVQGTCAGIAMTFPEASAGTFLLSNGVTVTNGGASPIFTPFGTVAQAGVLTVNSPNSGGTATVTVTAAGRITIP